MKLNHGLLVAFEGIDGSGKTTQAQLLAQQLGKLALGVVQSKEPTAGPWGMKIRESKHASRMPPEIELQAFLNDRRQHVAELLVPSLANGSVVIVDRYYFSTVAYQGARGLDPADLLRRNESFAPRPDLVVILDIEPQLALGRIASRGDTADLFEREDNLRKARNLFLDMRGDHVLHLDGARPVMDIHMDVLRRLYAGPLSTFMDEWYRDAYSWVDGVDWSKTVTPPATRDAAAHASAIAADTSISVEEKAAALLRRLAVK